MKYNPRENPLKLQDIHLVNGEDVTISWKKKGKCSDCGKQVWLALKDEELVRVELVSLASWDLHVCKKQKI